MKKIYKKLITAITVIFLWYRKVYSRYHCENCIRLLPSAIFLFCLIFYPKMINALPDGGTVVEGELHEPFNYSGDTLTVKQKSDRLIAEWQGFSIGNLETVTFQQPASSSIALNRVIGTEPSHILGILTANGRVFIINPNGILFGVNSKVDVAGLVASTLSLDMSDADFMSGGNNFKFSGSGGTALNYGTIRTLNEPGGYVALLGSSVKNVGYIEANLGKAILAAGEKITLDLDPAGLIRVVVDIDKPTGRNDRDEYAAVNNVGEIVADGGKVILTADILDSVFQSAVNNDGVIKAEALQEKDGEVLLKSNQNIELNGAITASGAIDAYAQENIILAKYIDDLTLSTFAWRYLSGSREYKFKEFGYYFGEDGALHVVLSKGSDIGKDCYSPTSGAGIVEIPGEPLGLYTIFDTTAIDNMGLLTYYQDPELNPDGLVHLDLEHLDKTGTEYAWEDMYNNGDQDFNDAIIDFTEDLITIEAPDAFLSSPDIFLTADNGSITQLSGDRNPDTTIDANNLILASNTGMSGIGSNLGIVASVDNISASNETSGNISISNKGILNIADLSAIAGLNFGVNGYNGIVNNAVGGEVNIEVKQGSGADLNVEAPVESWGPVIFNAEGNINHNADGDVTIHNTYLPPDSPNGLASPSHLINHPYLNDGNITIDVTWALPDSTPGYGFTGVAGGSYVMAPGSEILSQGGDVEITAKGESADVSLALIDAQNGKVSVTSENGDIIDADLGAVDADFDVIAHNIQLLAPNGSVGGAGPEEEIDLGYPYDFSYLWDNSNNTDVGSSVAPYNAIFNSDTGDWSFSTVSDRLTDGEWWFHIATIDKTGGGSVLSETAHLGAFILYSLIIPPPNPEYWERIERELRVYYEILSPSQFLSFEPATQLGLYAYHPLTPTDSSAFDDIKLDVGAYEFIEGNIRMTRPSPYFGLIPEEEIKMQEQAQEQVQEKIEEEIQEEKKGEKKRGIPWFNKWFNWFKR